MKYVFEVGGFGGQGGAPYSHEDGLKAAGLRLGVGPGSSRSVFKLPTKKPADKDKPPIPLNSILIYPLLLLQLSSQTRQQQQQPGNTCSRDSSSMPAVPLPQRVRQEVLHIVHELNAALGAKEALQAGSQSSTPGTPGWIAARGGSQMSDSPASSRARAAAARALMHPHDDDDITAQITAAVLQRLAEQDVWVDPQQPLDTPLLAGTDMAILGDSRVARVRGSASGAWLAGAVCLDFLAIETAPVGQAGPNTLASVGIHWLLDGPSFMEGGSCPSMDIPDGMTLAGFKGRTGDSWDQVSLLVCPWLPMGGTWDCHIHKHLLPPFKQQVRTFLLCLQQLQASGAVRPLDRPLPERLVAALFDATFFGDDPPSTQDSQQAGSTSSQQVAAGAASAATPSAAAAPATQQDFIEVWMQQQVQEARTQGTEKPSSSRRRS